MQLRRASAVGRSLRQEARRDRCIRIDSVVFFQQLKTYQNVQQHFDSANRSLNLGRNLLSGASLADGGEYVELQGRQNGATRHKAADHIVEDIALHAGVGDSLQARDLLSGLQVRRYDFGHIVRRQFRVPGALGINDHHRTAVTNPQTAAARDLDVVGESLAAKLAMQGVKNLERTCRRAAGNSFSFFLCANENVMTKRLHGDLQVSYQ